MIAHQHMSSSLNFLRLLTLFPTKKLCLKLDLIGIHGKVLTWIESFLTNRQQRVLVDNHSSQWSSVSSGVPQGFILGPLLFLIYVNDISYNLSSPTRMFADDCTLSRENKCRDDCVELQKDLTTGLRHGKFTWTLLSANHFASPTNESTNSNTLKCALIVISLISIWIFFENFLFAVITPISRACFLYDGFLFRSVNIVMPFSSVSPRCFHHVYNLSISTSYSCYWNTEREKTTWAKQN